MGNLARRLRTLEGRSGTPERKREESRAVLSRMTDDELEDYEELLEATTEPEEIPPILRRIEELTKEVRRERSA